MRKQTNHRAKRRFQLSRLARRPLLIGLVTLAGATTAICWSTATGQDSSLFRAGGASPSLRRASWTYIPVPPPKQLQMHDTVVVRVDELARVQSEGDFDRRKDALYDAILLDWIELIGLKAIKPNAQRNGDQRVRGQLQQLFRAEGELETRESLSFNIACTIADIRANGTVVLEGHKQIRVNDETWDFSLSGICRKDDIGPDNVVLSRNIVGLKIDKRENGHVRDSYKRGWFLRWLDEFHPF